MTTCLSNWIRTHRGEAILLAIIFVLAAALRLYKLEAYLHFLGDEGRDLRIVRTMLITKRLTFLGPTASVGGFYLGPIYYYMIAPWLLLFQFSPVGPAVMVALISLGLIAIVYWLGRKLTGVFGGGAAAILMAVSPLIVRHSRFSWNPNPVSFFTAVSFVSLWLAQKFWVWWLVAGISLGINVQLHYLTVITAPLILIIALLQTTPKCWPKSLSLLTLGFLLPAFPFLAFEVYHNFPNGRSILEFITRSSGAVQPDFSQTIFLLESVGRRLFELLFPSPHTQTALVLYWASFLWLIIRTVRAKKPNERALLLIMLIWASGGIVGLGAYKGTLHPYYFAFLFPLPFVLTGVLLGDLWKYRLLGKLLALLITSGLLYLMLQPMYPKERELVSLYLWQKPQYIVRQTRDIAQFVLAQAGGKPYNFALIADQNTDHAYRYFLELAGHQPVAIVNSILDPERKTVASQLFIVCESQKCEPLGHPLWEIAGFGRAEIVGQWDMVGGIKVFKLVHYQGK